MATATGAFGAHAEQVLAQEVQLRGDDRFMTVQKGCVVSARDAEQLAPGRPVCGGHGGRRQG